MRLLVILSMALVSFLPSTLGQSRSKPQSVCGVLRNIAQLRGKVITVRGIYHADYHGTTLGEKDCGERIQLDGVPWPVAIHLQSASYYLDEPEAQVKVPFSPDLVGIARIEGAISHARQENPSAEIRLSVTGLLIAPEKYPTTSEQGRTVKIGFGHGNKLPVELIVKSYSALALNKNPSASSSTSP
jgi:hypothetical protein